MLPENVDMKHYPWSAEIFLDYLTKGLRAAPVVRPSIYTSPAFPFIVLAGLASAAYIGYKLLATDALRHPAIWGSLAIMVYWFSTSGGM